MGIGGNGSYQAPPQTYLVRASGGGPSHPRRIEPSRASEAAQASAPLPVHCLLSVPHEENGNAARARISPVPATSHVPRREAEAEHTPNK